MPPHPHHPPHHGHHPGPHAVRWYHNSEGELNPAQVADLLQRVAEQLAEHGKVSMGNLKVTLPQRVHSVVRHELAPRGETVLKLEFQWFDGPASAEASPIESLLPATGNGGAAQPLTEQT
jgi:hypothetical protein